MTHDEHGAKPTVSIDSIIAALPKLKEMQETPNKPTTKSAWWVLLPAIALSGVVSIASNLVVRYTDQNVQDQNNLASSHEKQAVTILEDGTKIRNEQQKRIDTLEKSLAGYQEKYFDLLGKYNTLVVRNSELQTEVMRVQNELTALKEIVGRLQKIEITKGS